VVAIAHAIAVRMRRMSFYYFKKINAPHAIQYRAVLRLPEKQQHCLGLALAN